MKGYLTVFLAMSLSILTGFILMLIGGVIKNAGKVRLECALDTSMNAVLSEYNITLFERYGLLYIDASYLGRKPAISNVEERLNFYLEENTEGALGGKNTPWGKLWIDHVTVSSFETAVADMGTSMRNQAVCYVEDTGISGEERDAFTQMEEIKTLDQGNPMQEWSELMEQLAGMELPLVLNEKGIWEEVPLSNPADWVFELSGSDILYLSGIELQDINPAHISLENYISHRQIINANAYERKDRKEAETFITYLFNRMSYLGNVKEGSLLTCQLEYLVMGKDSDLENSISVAERLMKWRFAENLSRALTDGDLRTQAIAAAEELQAVQMKDAFREPVVESILYACAFLESIGDIKTIYSGGKIPVRKMEHQMAVDHVLKGNIYKTDDRDGLNFGQYLACMLLLTEEKTLNLRAMDIMEMDIRYKDGNENFALDWCIERYEVTVKAKAGPGITYFLRRKYGYF
ncbi:MAG: DUF5702 domain-containing protein [Suilimivivens sp.]